MKEESPKTFVRLRTTYWGDKRGFYQRKELTYLKKMSSGFQTVQDDVEMVGADVVFERITDLNQLLDGIYEIKMTNIQRDWETGYIDDWDYKLVDFV